MEEKKEFIKKVLEDLPTADVRYEMEDIEWYGWFSEVYDYAFKKGLEFKNKSNE